MEVMFKDRHPLRFGFDIALEPSGSLTVSIGPDLPGRDDCAMCRGFSRSAARSALCLRHQFDRIVWTQFGGNENFVFDILDADDLLIGPGSGVVHGALTFILPPDVVAGAFNREDFAEWDTSRVIWSPLPPPTYEVDFDLAKLVLP